MGKLLWGNYFFAFALAVDFIVGVFALAEAFASLFCVAEDSDISCFAVPSFAVAFGVAAAKLDAAPPTSDPATRRVTNTFFIFYYLSVDTGLNEYKVGFLD